MIVASNQPGSSQYGIDPLSGGDLIVGLTDVITYASSVASTNVASYNAAVTDVISSMTSDSLSLAVFGFGGSDKLDKTESNTTGTDWTVTYQQSFNATAQSSLTVSGTLEDDHQNLPASPYTFIYRDAAFGTFMFTDPAAPAGP